MAFIIILSFLLFKLSFISSELSCYIPIIIRNIYINFKMYITSLNIPTYANQNTSIFINL